MSQTLKLLLGTVSAVGNFFIVMFLGLTFAAQPSVYRNGLLYLAPAGIAPAPPSSSTGSARRWSAG